MIGKIMDSSNSFIPWLALNAKVAASDLSSRGTRLVFVGISAILLGFILSGPLDAIINPSLVSASFAPIQYAGRAMQGLAAFAGFAGCVLTAACAAANSSEGRLEMLVMAGWKPMALVLSRSFVAFGFLLLVGFVGAVCYFSVVPIGMAEMLMAFAVVYVPVIFFSVCFGATMAFATRSKTTAITAYGIWWALSIVWSLGLLGEGGRSPEYFATFTITGESLNLAFFEQPMSIRTPFDPSLGLSKTIWDTMAIHDQMVKDAAGMNLAFLLAFAVVLLLGCSAILACRWYRGQLSPSHNSERLTTSTSSLFLIVIKIIGASKVFFPSIIAVIPLVPLAIGADDPSSVVNLSACSILPIALSLTLIELENGDAFNASGCFVRTTLRYPIYIIIKTAIALLISFVSLLFVSIFWTATESQDLPLLLARGFVPLLILSSLSLALSSQCRFGAFAPVILLGIWVCMNLPAGFDFLASFGLSELHPLACIVSSNEKDLSVAGFLIWTCVAMLILFLFIQRKAIPHFLDTGNAEI